MLRFCLIIMYSKGSWYFPVDILVSSEELNSVFTTLQDLGIPKTAYYIHNDSYAIVSSAITGNTPFTSNCSCQAVGQFSQIHLQQYRLPSITGNLRFSALRNRRFRSTFVGLSKYSLTKLSITNFINSRSNMSVVEAPSLRYSATESDAQRYATVGIATVDL